MGVTDAARLTSVIAAIGIAINALELLTARERVFEFYDWSIVRTKYYWLMRHRRFLAILDFLFRPGIFATLLALQVLAALATPVLFQQPTPGAVLCLYVLATHLLIHTRLRYGLDGSDQMQTIIWASLFIFQVGNSEYIKNAAVIFIAAQLVLSYLTSGIAKAISPIWRGGSAVGLIIRTRSYGSVYAAQVVERLGLSTFLSRATFVFEVVGPFCILLGPGPTLGFLAGGLIFHSSIAAVMGLNSFVWAFVATFPAVYYVSQWFQF